MSDVAQGLAYLHCLDPPVVHGDLKPDNVLVTKTGSAVIIDFGLSLIMEHGTESAVPAPSTTASTSLQDAGNPRWMAPELFMQGSGIRSPSTDVYSFGSVALYIYTGKLPFARIISPWLIPLALEKGQTPMAHREEYIALFAPGMEWLHKLLLSCWDIEPDGRPSMKIAQETIQSRSTKGPTPA
ncbi:hypothetical protein FRC04_009093 [Tulasnella sp. 424]|nr:hypothetical protein FRC04_009093 [Tulasnella sp. 424]